MNTDSDRAAYQQWWQNEGSGMPPLCGEDAEEHVNRVTEIAWLNGAFRARAELAQPEPVELLEPRGCPTPGACSCPTAPIVPPDVIHVLEQAEADLSQHMPRIRQVLERWRGRAEATPLAQPKPGEAQELSRCLRLISDGMAALGHERDSWLVARAATLLQQLAPIPTP